MTDNARRRRPFAQIDVFSQVPFRGNALAVVLDGTDLTDDQMARFANWTNLSETTFILPPHDPSADYLLRIFTASNELPFAGHPTLGSAHAWLAAGGEPKGDNIIFECGLGLVTVARRADKLAFAAPTPLRRGPVEPALVTRVAAALGLTDADIVDHQWVDNGPGWLAVLLASAERVLSLEPVPALIGDLKVGVVGPATDGGPTQFQVRAFFGHGGVVDEDPVTGSLNASVGQWLIESGRAASSYVAGQGARLGRDGRVHIERVDGQVWVAGHSVTCISGTVEL
ncbi:PhzF family phenazine biosynthesis protein [Nakamurella sp. UYEF19]|uniref:PhzF family phenazine biosynthesis protein n=1 Tax=Nakamurella sp. UYEF19 TaxID=1756392 RepID=UPI003397DCCE